jgi:hypothetical protein
MIETRQILCADWDTILTKFEERTGWYHMKGEWNYKACFPINYAILFDYVLQYEQDYIYIYRQDGDKITKEQILEKAEKKQRDDKTWYNIPFWHVIQLLVSEGELPDDTIVITNMYI